MRDQQRWDSLTKEQKQTFANICPDFVVELRSSSDRLQPLQAKMQEYREFGVKGHSVFLLIQLSPPKGFTQQHEQDGGS